MDAKLKADWVAALRSGKYHQATGYLYLAEPNHPTSYCCIGVGYVACIEPVIAFGDETDEAANRLGIDPDFRDDLIDMNDKQHKSFSEIADWIEANIPADPSSLPLAEA